MSRWVITITLFLILAATTGVALKPKTKVTHGPRRPVTQLLRAGGPDDYGYVFKDDQEPGGPTFSWIDTVGAESLSIAGDDTVGLVQLPFPFRFYGQVYDSVWVCTNGWISFGSHPGTSTYENESVPSPNLPNNAVFAFWDDLAVGEFFLGNIYARTVDTAPNRKFAIIWQDVACNFMADPVTFEVVFDEADSSITLQYLDVLCSDPYSDSGGTATVGIESDTSLAPNQTGLLYSWDEKALAAGRAIRFSLLPQAANDVGVHAILTPRGHNRTGVSVTPSALVRNYGLNPQANVPVRCSILGLRGAVRYADEYVIPTIPASNSLMVYFDPWLPTTPETCNVTVSTWLPGDEQPGNDRLSRQSAMHQAHFFGGPDAGFMRWLDSDTTAGPTYEWRDISTSGTPVVFHDYDNAVASIPVGFNFGFYDSLYSSVYVGTNGYLVFGSAIVRIDNDTIPHERAPNNAIYPFWDDLDCIGPGRVRYQTFGTTPNCTLVVSYDSVRIVAGGDSSLLFQVLLCENSNDIVMRYRDVQTSYAPVEYGMSATIGIEASAGSTGLCYLFGSDTIALPMGNLLSAGRAIRFYFGGRQGDIGVTSIVAPSGYVNTNSRLTPRARCRNFYTMPTDFRAFMFLEDPTGTRVYSESVFVSRLAPVSDTVVSFPWCSTGTNIGRWGVKCSTVCVADTFPANNFLSDTFTLTAPAGIWTEMSSMPDAPSNRRVKDGAWLVYDFSRGRAYAAKGNKTSDFYTYSLLLDTWVLRSSIPLGREQKQPGKGAAGCATGTGFIYAVKGNNTCGFYRYDIDADTWLQMRDVPLGTGNRKVKGGAGMVYVEKPEGGQVYLLKGIKSEFYRYDPAQDTWFTLADAPRILSDKWDKGSWLVHDGTRTAYAHKAKYHEFFCYDTDGDSWHHAPRTGMPFMGRSGRNKKSKDGGTGAFFHGSVFALKGGNTQEFWKYVPGSDSWIELDTIPTLGSSGARRKIKAGASIAGMSSGLGVLKGNKTGEFWVYTPNLAPAQTHAQPAVQARSATVSRALEILPNPLRAGFATLRWNTTGMPGTSGQPPSISIFDAAGRCVLRSSFGLQSSSVLLDLRSLRPGVYLLRVQAGTSSTTQKLVVQR
jgi:hypothetical protein